MRKKILFLITTILIISHSSYSNNVDTPFYVGGGANYTLSWGGIGLDAFTGYEVYWKNWLYSDIEFFGSSNPIWGSFSGGARIFNGIEIFDGLRLYGNAGYIYNNYLQNGFQLGLGTQFKIIDSVSIRTGANYNNFTGFSTVEGYLSAIYHFSL